MKKLNLLSAILMLSMSTHAQVNFDSLLATWNDTNQADTIRLNAMNELCYDFARIRPDSTLTLAGAMLDLAMAKGLRRYEVDAIIQQSRSHAMTDNVTGGLDAASRSADLSKEIEYPYGLARALAMTGVLYKMQGDFPMAVNYYDQALVIAKDELADAKNGHIQGEIKAYPLTTLVNSLDVDLGLVYQNMGDYIKSLEYFDRALKWNEARGIKDGVARILNNIATLYKDQGDPEKAQQYFDQALEIAEEIGDKYAMAAALGNIGNIHLDRGEYPAAEEYFTRALELNKEIGDQQRIGGGMLQFAQLNLSTRDYDQARQFVDQAAVIFESMGAKNTLAYLMLYRGSIDLDQGNFNQATQWCEQGLNLSEEINSIQLQRDACDCLYQAYKSLNQSGRALAFHEQFKTLKDSLNTDETGKKLQQMEFSKQILADSLVNEEEKLKVQMANDAEVHKKDQTRNVLFGSGFLMLLVAGGLWSRLRFTRKSKAVLQIEKDRSESLLLNILPAEVAEELKLNGEALARDFDMVSIIFTHFTELSPDSTKISAGELVDELNYCFKGFDMIMEKYAIEKIKTIGDAYMAAGGMAEDSEDSAKNTVRAALEMQEFISKRKAEQDALGLMAFEMRAGIHTGPVVAGIVGVKKFQYDIWGDTVNTASRMESNGQVGHVNISHDTYELIKNDPVFTFKNRGKIKAKGKGEMDMYFVS